MTYFIVEREKTKSRLQMYKATIVWQSDGGLWALWHIINYSVHPHQPHLISFRNYCIAVIAVKFFGRNHWPLLGQTDTPRHCLFHARTSLKVIITDRSPFVHMHSLDWTLKWASWSIIDFVNARTRVVIARLMTRNTSSFFMYSFGMRMEPRHMEPRI